MKSFTFRLTCRLVVVVTTTAAAVLTAGGFLLHRENEQALELLHEVELHELRDLLGNAAPADPAAVAQRLQHDADQDAALFLIQVANDTGTVLFRSSNLGDSVLPPLSPRSPHATVALPRVGRVHLSYAESGPWRLHVGSLLAPTDRLLREYVRISIALLAGVAAISVALGYAVSRAALRPLRAIERTAQRIGADNLSERIPVPPGRDELVSLTLLLNQTFDRLQAAFEQVRHFTGDVSHELKTPLALVRLNVEKLRARAGNDPETVAVLGDVLEEIARLHTVIDRLLFLAKSESGAWSLAARPLTVPDWLKPIAEDAAVLAEDRGVRFQLARNEPGELRGDPELLRQLLLNLLANAVSVSRSGAGVELASEPAGDAWRFVVIDEGPGLPEAELARMFQRFVRFEHRPETGVPQRAGHGLGLAICKSIVGLHGGTLRAENRPDRSGLRVIAELPRAGRGSA